MGIQGELHQTEYGYERAFLLGSQVIHLRPAPRCRTPIFRDALEVAPADHMLIWQFDALANPLARAIFRRRTSELKQGHTGCSGSNSQRRRPTQRRAPKEEQNAIFPVTLDLRFPAPGTESGLGSKERLF